MKYTMDGKMYQMTDAPVRSLEERIQRLEDRASIEECMYHYTNSCDNCDPAGMASCFTETGILSWGDVYDSQLEGREAILASLQKMMGSATTGTHLISNMQIYFETKDSALVHCYMHSWQCFKDYPRTSDCYTYGRYELQVVRDTDGEWRFQSFKLIMAGQKGGHRACEQYDRPWPLVPCTPKTTDR